MHLNGDAPSVVRFGPFTFDGRSGELRNGATRLRVPDQSLAILQALLERPGELVTRETLRDRLWPPDTHVDFEAGLNAAVRRLREALNDSADVPRYVETLPRRGYRFIAPGEGTLTGAPPAPAESAVVATEVSALAETVPLGRAFYTKESAHGIRKVPAEGGQEVQVTDRGRGMGFDVADDGVFYMNWSVNPAAVEMLGFASQQFVTVAQLPPRSEAVANLAVSRDGRSILYVEYESRHSDIEMLREFR